MTPPIKIPEKLIRSKERVRDLAEVYTAKQEVDAMLDLLKNQCTNPGSRFLEPACGNGNFLVGILERKYAAISRKYKSQSEFEYFSLVALSSVYGIDICAANVKEAQARLLQQFRDQYHGGKRNTWKQPDYYFHVAEIVINKNIVNGDALNEGSKITLTEWSFPSSLKVKQRSYKFSDLYLQTPVAIEEKPITTWKDLVNE